MTEICSDRQPSSIGRKPQATRLQQTGEVLYLHGFKVSARLLNAMYFHVPQSRQRLIFIGVREDLGIEPSHPKAESKPIAIKSAWGGTSLGDDAPSIDHYAIGNEWKLLAIGEKSNRYLSLVRPSLSKPSPTLTKKASSMSAASVCHPTICRKYTSREAKRVGSFPDDYIFQSHIDCLFRIGNSVPPLFMEAISE